MSKNENEGVTRLETERFEAIDAFDPSLEDEGYWARFRFRVMTAAAEELYRRRFAAEASVVGVMERWSRTLAPVAAVAAAIAGFLLLQDLPGAGAPVDVAEALIADIGEQELPAFIEDVPADGVQFASESW